MMLQYPHVVSNNALSLMISLISSFLAINSFLTGDERILI